MNKRKYTYIKFGRKVTLHSNSPVLPFRTTRQTLSINFRWVLKTHGLSGSHLGPYPSTNTTLKCVVLLSVTRQSLNENLQILTTPVRKGSEMEDDDVDLVGEGLSWISMSKVDFCGGGGAKEGTSKETNLSRSIPTIHLPPSVGFLLS